jgi:hypothetical protein
MVNEKLANDYRRGYDAFSHVEERKNKRFGVRYHQVANPMRKNTTSAKEWQRGWNKAYLDNLKALVAP